MGIGAATAVVAIGAALAAPLTTRIDGPPRAVLSEPDIAVNPLDARQVIVVAKDITAQGQPALDVFRSTDGGAGFTGGRVVAGSYLGAPADASDPVVLFDRMGTALFGQLVWRYPGRGFESLLGVQRSADGGATFGSTATIVRTFNRRTPLDFGAPPDPSITHDKEWLALDRATGTIYAAWVQISIARGRQRNRIVVARSVDGGSSFSRPRFVSRSRRFAVGPQLAVGRDGAVHVVWASFRAATERRASVLSARSTDGGAHFSAPRRVARFRSSPAAEILVALDATTRGRLLACWSRAHARGSSQTICARSRTGRRWSRPVLVAPGVEGAHRLVAVAAEGSRTFWVSFYAMTGQGATVRLYRSRDLGRHFAFARVLARRRVVSGFVGDYSGLEVAAGRVYAAYAVPRGMSGGRNAIFVTSLPTM